MATPIQVTFDCSDPDRLATFWAGLLGYKVQDPPEGFDSWPAFLAEQGVPEDRWNAASAAVDPDGHGPRLYFQRVPEGKVVKNRLHLDVNVGAGIDHPAARRERVDAEVDRAIALGATKVRESDNEFGEHWVVMRDVEGNEFCLQ